MPLLCSPQLPPDRPALAPAKAFTATGILIADQVQGNPNPWDCALGNEQRDSLLSSVCADAVDAGHDVTLVGQTPASIPAVPGALQRCLTNLIDNAVKYGGYARVTAACEAGSIVIRVADGGPGIPEAQMERVFDPILSP